MPSPAFVRLGPSSAERSSQLAKADTGPYADTIDLICAQVPKEFGPGSLVWLWLGSDNNKGQPTEWTQGIHALARCHSKIGPREKQFSILLDNVLILERTVEKFELLTHTPETYTSSLIDTPIVGINNYASQVVQVVSDEEFATIGAIIADLLPESREALLERVPGADAVEIVPRKDKPAEEGWTTVPPPPPFVAEIDEADVVFRRVLKLLFDDKVGGVLLVGPPGTGKSWYARQIAIMLTKGERSRIREVQFHPAYQYEDFVEGYVPKEEGGFTLRPKHLLEMADTARQGSELAVLVIDEFSRTDPARVLGETLTYMERSLRGVEFHLPSGRKVSIPENLVFLATMNPEDRSVDEIDAAMERRWAKIELKPDPNKVRDFLQGNEAPNELIAPIMTFFVAMQNFVEVGHAFFKTVHDVESLERLWDTQLKFVVSKRFRFEPETLDEVKGLWEACLEEARAATGAPGPGRG